MPLQNILTRAQELQSQLIQWRRDFHQHPELAYQEERTAAIVAAHLEALGYEVQTGVGKTGVVGLLRGQEPGKTIALRADMDALPIQDAKDVPYASQNQNLAHLCGHDAHTSMLMGAAQILAEQGRPAKGNIKLVFQPAEEGQAGARAMINDGVLEEPKVDAIAGLHVFPGLDSGTLSVTNGDAFASADAIKIRIIGKGGHAARPHEGVDAIAAAASVVTGLQHIASRLVNPLETVVVTIGKIEGGTIGAAIASEVTLTGTVRTLSPAVRSQMPGLLHQVIGGIVQSFGASYELSYEDGYPVVFNNESMVHFFTATSEQLLGEKRWEYVPPSTGGEDFAFYAEKVPGVFFRLGTGNEDKRTRFPLHNPNFDLDEQALLLGAATLAAMGLQYLNQ